MAELHQVAVQYRSLLGALAQGEWATGRALAAASDLLETNLARALGVLEKAGFVVAARPAQNSAITDEGRQQLALLMRAVALRPDQLSENTTNPREDWTSAEALADMADLKASIAAAGIHQGLKAKPAGADGRHEIIMGERRWRAVRELAAEKGATIAGQPAADYLIPVVIEAMSDLDAMIAAVVENELRRDLSPMEKARRYTALKAPPYNMSAAQIAKATGKGKRSVEQYIALLKKPPEVQEAVAAGKVSFKKARAHGSPSAAPDHVPTPRQAKPVAETTAALAASVGKTVERGIAPPTPTTPAAPEVSGDLKALLKGIGLSDPQLAVAAMELAERAQLHPADPALVGDQPGYTEVFGGLSKDEPLERLNLKGLASIRTAGTRRFMALRVWSSKPASAIADMDFNERGQLAERVREAAGYPLLSMDPTTPGLKPAAPLQTTADDVPFESAALAAAHAECNGFEPSTSAFLAGARWAAKFMKGVAA